MSKITSKLQVTIPKAIADRLGLKPGDEIDWEASAGGLRIILPGQRRQRFSLEERIELFEQATRRQEERQATGPAFAPAEDRGWTREDLYVRGRPD